MTHRGQTGAVPVEFAAAVGLLLLPVFVFVMTIAPVVERRTVGVPPPKRPGLSRWPTTRPAAVPPPNR